MGGLIVRVIAIGLIYWLIYWVIAVYWYITLTLGAVGLGIYLLVKANEKEKRRQAAEAARKAEEVARLQRHREEQQGYREQMIVLREQSLGLFESMPKHLSSAEKYLDQAEVDFADGAFAPFWDSIENAAKTLGHFDEEASTTSKITRLATPS